MTKDRVNIKRVALAVILAVALCVTALLIGCGSKPDDGEYTVVFYEAGGSTVEPVVVKYGEKIKRPENPTKEGEIFLGWYKDRYCTVKWDFAKDVVVGTTVLFAKWSGTLEPGVVPGGGDEPGTGETPGTGEIPGGSDIKTTIVYFNVNGGSQVSSQIVTSGGTATRPSDPHKANFDFAGWYSDSACTKSWNFASDTVSGLTVIIYAKWTPVSGGDTPGGDTPGGDTPGGDTPGEKDPNEEYDPVVGTGENVTVTFNVGLNARKAGASNPPAQTVKGGSTISVPSVSYAGYTLDGWYVEDGNTKWNFAKDLVDKNTTLFARWSSGSSSNRVDYTPTMTNDNTLYIHYKRSSSDYSGWHIWAWKEGSNGQWYEKVKTDSSGAVYPIPFSMVGSSEKVCFKIALNSWDSSDGSDNSVMIKDAMKVGNSYHWFVSQGSVADGKNYLSESGSSTGTGATTEPKRASRSNVNRAYAQGLPIKGTVSGWDDVGVGYQIFVASFCDSNGDGVGDIKGITSKLGYFKDLNVDVLWLTPIQSSDSYHGYDCYDYYAIDKKFGTNADYRELVYKAHQKGIKVIMDLVVNHTSTQNEWFLKSKEGVIEEVTYQDGRKETVNYRDFYRWSNSGGTRQCSAGDGWYYYSSFNNTMPELNYDYQPARDAMVDVASYWMSYGLDGFRMDAIKHVYMWGESDDSGCQKGPQNDPGWEFNLTKNIEFFKEFNYKLKTKFPHCFLLGEQLSGDVDYVSPFYKGMDSLFDFNSYYNMPDKIGNGDVSAVANTLNSNAQKYTQQRGDRAINSMISSNHDIPRLSSKYPDYNKRKLYMAIALTMPGISWIYYGDEIGLLDTGSGDNAHRQSMKWTSSYENKCTAIGYGASNDGIKSVADQKKDGDSLLSYISALTKVRNDYPALINGTATCSVSSNGMLKIVVRGSSKTVTAYHNFSGSTKNADGGGTLVFGSANIGAYGTAIFVN